MKLPEIGVKQPVLTMMIFFSVLVLGVVSLTYIPIDLLPEMEQPAVSIITPYFGVGAEDIERLVTKEIENSAKQVAGVDKITSITKDNISVVSLRFKWGTNTDEAMNDIRGALEFAKRDLPGDIEPPQLFKFNTAQWPILFYLVTATKSYPDLRTLVDKKVADRVKTVPGVGTVRVIAGLRRQMNIELDLDRLSAYNIPITRIAEVLKMENVTVTAGMMDMGRHTYPIRMPAEFTSVEQIGEVVVGMGENGAPIKIRDIGRVVDGYNDQDERVFLNGKSALLFMVMKQSGGNTVEVADDVKKRIAEISPNLPDDVKIVSVYDMSEFIMDSIRNLRDTILIGGVLVILVVYLFLWNTRSSLVIAVTIPFSLIMALISLYFMHYTINMMSLMSLAVAIGMVVDNAIVVVDNVTRHIEQGKGLKKACIDGTSEVGLAVSASTFTTIIIFVPLLYISGFAGVLFKQLAFAVAVTLLGSLLASLMLSPMMISKLFTNQTKHIIDEGRKKEGYYKKFEKRYTDTLDLALKHPVSTILISIGIFILSLGLLIVAKTKFMPNEDTGDFKLTMELPAGTNVDESTLVGLQVMDIMMKTMVGTNGKQEWENIFMRTGQSRMGFSSGVGEKEGDNIIECSARMIKRKLRTRSTFDYADMLRPKIAAIPGIMRFEINAGNIMSQFFGGGKPLQIQIKGPDLAEMNKYANLLMAALKKKIPELQDLALSSNMGRPSLNLMLDRERASLLGLNPALAAMQLRLSIFGDSITKYRVADNDYDIFLRVQEADKQSIDQIRRIPLVNLMNKTVTIGNIATVERGVTPLQIDRLDQERVVMLEGGFAEDANMTTVIMNIQNEIQALKAKLPKGVTVKIGGSIEDMKNSYRDLFFVFILGMVLVFMVMAAQFENYLDPFIIMFSVPFALTGVFLFTVITRTSFSIYSFLGLIMLVGIVVNNAIVFVDYANIQRRHGHPLLEALRITGKNRLRPILMTSLTTIFGMLPMAVNNSEGAEFWRPLGISCIGGLTISGAVTLLLIPAMYYLIYRRLEKSGRGVRHEIVIED